MAIGEQSDEALVARVHGGNRELFSVLVDRYKRGIANFIAASVRSPADAADLSQETFLRAYAHLGTFNPTLGKFSTWIYQIARNVVRTLLERAILGDFLSSDAALRSSEMTPPRPSGIGKDCTVA